PRDFRAPAGTLRRVGVTMTVRVRLFARARDLAGTDRLELILPVDARVGDLRQALSRVCPALASFLDRCAIAVQDEFASDDTPLSAESEVAVLPPVSGGT